MTDLLVPDVSEYQGAVDWRTLVSSGYPAAIIRAHNGSRMDGEWAVNRAGAHAAGVTVLGIYQYLDPSVDAAQQANELCDLIGALRPGEWPICDLEVGAGDQSARAHAWYVTVAGRLHDAAAEELYSDLSFWQEHNLSSGGFARAWVAAYGSQEPAIKHDLWQFSESQSFPGISGPCDANVFHGTVADLLALTDPESTMPLNAADEAAIKSIVTAAITANRPVAVADTLYWMAAAVTGNPPAGGVSPVDEHSIAELHAALVAGPSAQIAALSAKVVAAEAALAAVEKGALTVAEVQAAVAAALAAAGHVAA
jgi:lysozyme